MNEETKKEIKDLVNTLSKSIEESEEDLLEETVSSFNNAFEESNNFIAIESIEKEFFRLLLKRDEKEMLTYFSKKEELYTALVCYSKLLSNFLDKTEGLELSHEDLVKEFPLTIPQDKLGEIYFEDKNESSRKLSEDIFIESLYYYIQSALEKIVN